MSRNVTTIIVVLSLFLVLCCFWTEGIIDTLKVDYCMDNGLPSTVSEGVHSKEQLSHENGRLSTLPHRQLFYELEVPPNVQDRIQYYHLRGFYLIDPRICSSVLFFFFLPHFHIPSLPVWGFFGNRKERNGVPSKKQSGERQGTREISLVEDTSGGSGDVDWLPTSLRSL